MPENHPFLSYFAFRTARASHAQESESKREMERWTGQRRREEDRGRERERERERGKGVLPCVARASEPFYPLVAGSGGCTSCTCAYACIHPPSCAHSRARCTRRARSCTRRRRYLSLSLSLSLLRAHTYPHARTLAHTHTHTTRARSSRSGEPLIRMSSSLSRTESEIAAERGVRRARIAFSLLLSLSRSFALSLSLSLALSRSLALRLSSVHAGHDREIRNKPQTR